MTVLHVFTICRIKYEIMSQLRGILISQGLPVPSSVCISMNLISQILPVFAGMFNNDFIHLLLYHYSLCQKHFKKLAQTAL